MEPNFDKFFADFGACFPVLLSGVLVLVCQVVEHPCCLFHFPVELSVSLIGISQFKPAGFTSCPEAKSAILKLRERIGDDVLEYNGFASVAGVLNWPEVSAREK